MDDLREEIGMQVSLTERLVRSRIMWTSHVVRMDEGRLPKIANGVKQQDRR